MTDFPTDGSAALNRKTGAGPSPRLVSLAILKANWNQQRSYLDNFIPFVGECLRVADCPVSPRDVKASLRSAFGMRIPEHTVFTLLSRAVKLGYATRSGPEGRLFHRVADVVSTMVLTPRQNEFLRCHEALVERLRSFAEERYQHRLSLTEATAALDAYVDEYGASIALRGAAAELEFEPTVVATPDIEYIVHALVQELASADPASFRYLETIVEGSMLAAVVYLPDAGSLSRRFRDATVFLDTPFLLRLLGHLGDELREPAAELVELLKAYGAGIACFEKTITELRGVLIGAAGSAASGRAQSAVATTLMQRGLRRADIELLAAGLERDLERRGIRALPSPPFTLSVAVDEVRLDAILNEEVHYPRANALAHDRDALTATYRLRQGRAQPILEDSRAIFLTTNTALVRAASRFFGTDGSGFSWPVAILDTDLATLVWLKQPMKAPDLPRKQIMADCYAALRPNQQLWHRWLDEIDRTERNGTYSDEHLALMRFHPDAQRALMDRTMGEVAMLDDRTVEEVLAVAASAITAPLAGEVASLRAERDEERLRRLSAEEAATVSREAVETRLGNLRSRADRRAKGWARCVLGVMLLIVAVGTLMSLTGSVVPGRSWPWPIRLVAGGASALTILLAYLSVAVGTDAKSVGRRVESWLAPRLLRRYMRAAGETD